MTDNDRDTAPGKHIPKFYVTQEVFDAATPEEREKRNYVVDTEETISLPRSFNLPKGAEIDG